MILEGRYWRESTRRIKSKDYKKNDPGGRIHAKGYWREETGVRIHERVYWRDDNGGRITEGREELGG